MNTQNTAHIPRIATASASPDAAARTASIALDPAFLGLANEFGMIPERMAERILSAFAATPPSHLIVKARRSATEEAGGTPAPLSSHLIVKARKSDARS